MLQKKFDRLLYILMANINKGLENDVLTESATKMCEILIKLLE